MASNAQAKLSINAIEEEEPWIKNVKIPRIDRNDYLCPA